MANDTNYLFSLEKKKERVFSLFILLIAAWCWFLQEEEEKKQFPVGQQTGSEPALIWLAASADITWIAEDGWNLVKQWDCQSEKLALLGLLVW